MNGIIYNVYGLPIRLSFILNVLFAIIVKRMSEISKRCPEKKKRSRYSESIALSNKILRTQLFTIIMGKSLRNSFAKTTFSRMIEITVTILCSCKHKMYSIILEVRRF